MRSRSRWLLAFFVSSMVPIAPVRASELVSFRLSNMSELGVSETFFDLLPSGTIAPPLVEGPDGAFEEASPLRALPSSRGVPIDSTFVLLGEEPLPTGTPGERLFLLFGFEPNPAADQPGEPPYLPQVAGGYEPNPNAGQPGELAFRPVDPDGARLGLLEPMGVFDFELSLDTPASSILLSPGVEGLTLTMLETAPEEPSESPTPPAPGDGTTVPIPEPSTLLAWASVASAVLFLSRRRRSRKSIQEEIAH